MKLSKVFAVLFIVGLSIYAINAWGYEYDGPLDPTEITTWKEVGARPLLVGGNLFIEVMLQNPDENATIKAACLLLHPETNGVVAYRYMIEGVQHVYAWDNGKQRYVQTEPVQPARFRI